MSTNLYARPKTPDTGESLPDALKFVLRKRHGGDLWHRRIYTLTDLEYLSGLVDCDVPGAQELMDLIAKHGEIEVWEGE